VIRCYYAAPRSQTRLTVLASPLVGGCPVALNSLGGVPAISDPRDLRPKPRVL